MGRVCIDMVTAMPCGRKEAIPSGDTFMPCGKKEVTPSGDTFMPCGRKEVSVDMEKRTSADKVLNDLLVKLFKNIMEIEEKYLITPEFKDISVNDMHIIEAIGLKEPKSMSAVAKLMSVTMGTLTKSMDGLSDKNYVVRERGKKDKRVVFASLTEKGRRAYFHHESFHRNMIARLKDGINEQETTVLIFALAKLNDYFNQIYEQ